jgi:hypothetical protein
MNKLTEIAKQYATIRSATIRESEQSDLDHLAHDATKDATHATNALGPSSASHHALSAHLASESGDHAASIGHHSAARMAHQKEFVAGGNAGHDQAGRLHGAAMGEHSTALMG